MKQIYDNKDIGETIDKSFDAGIEEGYRRCREQMMEDAKEGKIIFLLNGDVAVNIGDTDEYKLGQKVRVIVLPKED